MKKRLLSLILSTAIAISSFGTAVPAFASDEEKSLVIGVTKDWASVNSLAASNTSNTFVAKLICDTLLDKKIDGTAVPRLAQSWDYDGDVTVTFHLAENAVWSDGEPVTAEDVVYTFQLISDPEIAVDNTMMALIAGTDDNGFEIYENSIAVTADDDYTLTVTLKNPVLLDNFLDDLKTIVILPKHAYGEIPSSEIKTSEVLDNPVGSGPYQVVNHIAGSTLELTANENYFQGAPNIDNLTIRLYTTATLAAALASGEAQVTGGANVSEISYNDYEYLSTLDNITIDPFYSYNYQYLPINNSLEAYSDARVRQALSLAINREEIVTNLFHGDALVIYTPYNEIHPFYAADLAYPAYDPEAAKELLNEAGWNWDYEIQLVAANNDENRLKAVQLVQQYWQQIGLKVNLTEEEYATNMAGIQEGTVEIGTMGTPGGDVAVETAITRITEPNETSSLNFFHLQTSFS